MTTGANERLCANLLAIIEKRSFLNGEPTGIAEGWPEMDRSKGYIDRKSCTGTWSAAGEVPAE
jgi:hypothetical protein